MVLRYTPLPTQGGPQSVSQSSSESTADLPSSSSPNHANDAPVNIDSGSSSISGHYTLSKQLSLHTTSGSISITVTPLTSTSASSLTTESTSGSIDVTVLPLSATASASRDGSRGSEGVSNTSVGAAATLRKLSGRHISTSGSVTIRYPQGWEGEIRASSVSGSVEVKGRDVVVERDGTVGNRRVIKARKGKGKGEGMLVVESESGTVEVVVGDA